MRLEQATAQKVRQLLASANGAIPEGQVKSTLSFDELNLASRERWLVPNFETPGFFERGPATAMVSMEAFGQLGPNPLYPSTDKKREALAIGRETTVVDKGKAFKGRIQKRNPDGSVTVSFEGERPARDKFQADELGEEPGEASQVHKTELTPNASPSDFKYKRF